MKDKFGNKQEIDLKEKQRTEQYQSRYVHFAGRNARNRTLPELCAGTTTRSMMLPPGCTT
jgi:hypothetical protein